MTFILSGMGHGALNNDNAILPGQGRLIRDLDAGNTSQIYTAGLKTIPPL